jgi:hypothetical protein
MPVSPGPRLGLATLTLSVLLTTTAYAQTARMTGTVIDSTTAVVPGATVTIVNAESNDKRVAVSNQYNVPFLPSGRYTATCEVLNSFMLDGVDNNARIVDQQNSSNVVSQPSVDALSEFSIQTNNFSAEYGQAAGAVINATIRSGTNRFRGVGFDFLRNDGLDA